MSIVLIVYACTIRSNDSPKCLMQLPPYSFFPTAGLQTPGLYPLQVMLSHAQLRPPLPLRPPPRLILLPCLLLCSLLLASPPLAHAGWWSSGSKDVPALPTVAHDQVAPVRLDWEGITCELKLKTKEGSKNLLSQVRSGEILGLLAYARKEGREMGWCSRGREGGRVRKKGKGRLTGVSLVSLVNKGG